MQDYCLEKIRNRIERLLTGLDTKNLDTNLIVQKMANYG